MSDAVSYTAVLPVAETVLFVSRLLAVERRRRGTRSGRRALGCYRQAVLVWRWFVDGTRLAQLAAAAAPGLRRALLAARAAGHAHLHVDGTLIRTDRCSAPGPTARTDRPERRVDLGWSGKHATPGGNVQVVTAPDGRPLWTSEVRPGREHDTAARRAHVGVLPLLAEWTDTTHAVLADLGYEGKAGHPDHPDQADGRRAADRRPAHPQPPACDHPSGGRTRQRAAHDHLHRAAPSQPLPLADRRHHRRRPRPPAPPAQPHHMIISSTKPSLGKAH